MKRVHMKVFLKGSVEIVIRHFNKLHFKKFLAVSLEFSFKLKKVLVWPYNIFLLNLTFGIKNLYGKKREKKLTEKLLTIEM
jgi:hypothetical protein